jgi:aquaporin Z
MNVKAAIAELIGSFILVFIGTATGVLAGSTRLGDGGMAILAIAFAFGFTLVVLVYTIGPISGCHVNPAVTIAMLIAKKISVNDAVPYMVAQVIGGILASVVLRALLTGIQTYVVAQHGLGESSKAAPGAAGLAIGGLPLCGPLDRRATGRRVTESSSSHRPSTAARRVIHQCFGSSSLAQSSAP